MDPLEGLDRIDWASFEHAYGPATDVPGWLRMLASEDPEPRKSALDAIEASVNHQGWISPAAIPTVPFLVALFEASIERADLAVLLADMSVGGFHGNFAIDGFDPASVPDDWRQMREAVIATHPRFIALLGDPDAKVRAAGAVALGVLSERADEGRAALRERMKKERTKEPLACMALALALLDVRGSPPEDDVATLRALASHRSKLVSLAARIALAQLTPSKDNALAALHAAEDHPERERDVPWNGGRLADLAQRAAVASMARTGDAESLSDLVDAVGLDRVVPPVLELLLGPYPADRPDVPLAFEELPPRAQSFAKLVARKLAELRAKNAWYNPAFLSQYGICDVERLTGLRPPRPLDERFEGDWRWRIARRVRDGGAAREAWPACLRGLPEDQIEDVVRDLATTVPIPYELSSWWPKGKWGYDADVAMWVPYDALTADAARLLPRERLGALMEWLLENPRRGRVIPIVDVYGELLGAPIEPRFEPVLRVAIAELHSDGENVRRILARVPPERREALAEDMHFDIYMGPSSRGGRAVYFRVGWHLCDLVPTEGYAKKAAASLVRGRLLQGDGAESLVPELVSGLASRFAAFGSVGRATLQAVLPSASTETASVLEAVLGRV